MLDDYICDIQCEDFYDEESQTFDFLEDLWYN